MADIQLRNGIQLPENAIKFFVSAPIDNGIEPKVPISFVQYDTGLVVVAFNILKDNQIYIPPEDAKIWVRMNKPDGHGVYIETLGADDMGTVYFIVPQQMTTAYGTGSLSLELNTTEGQKNTKTVPVYISKNPIQDEQIKSTDDFKTLYDILIYVMSVEALINENQDALTFIKNNSEQIEVLFGITNEIVICANNSDSIKTTATNIDSVNTVSTNIQTVKNVNDNIETIKSVDSNKENINNVAQNKANIDIVAQNQTNIENVSNNIADINNVNDNIDAIVSVNNNEQNINSVSENIDNILSVKNNETNINTVSTNIASVNTVSTNINDVNTVVQNLQSIKDAPIQAQKAEDNAILSESWAVGGTGTREGEDTNNAKYWAEQAQAISSGSLGYFETPEQLTEAHPTGTDGEWAIVGSTDTIWVWDKDTNKWKDSAQSIDLANYYTKTQSDQLFAKDEFSSKTVKISINPSSWTENSGNYKAEYTVDFCKDTFIITNVSLNKDNTIQITKEDIDNASKSFEYAETQESKIILYSTEIPQITIDLYFTISNSIQGG